MLEILKFIFSSFWIWLGAVIMLVCACSVFCAFTNFIGGAIRPFFYHVHNEVKKSSDGNDDDENDGGFSLST